MEQHRVTSWWAQWTCVGGTCAPPAAPPRTGIERLFRLLHPAHGSAAPARCCRGGGRAHQLLAQRPGGPLGHRRLHGGLRRVLPRYLSRCREAHCVVTGTGWSVVALGAATGAVTGRPTLSEVWLAFALVALVGHGFEAIWRSARGTNALRL